ncbi:MAG TPA: sugar phosphate isomerase/epimerase [Parafilimonas sp.]|nr:sugar phosphate isomerase/epimerase [Parafilimonas sp.]
MKTSRRTFIKQAGITFAGTALLPRKILATGNATDFIVGIQLYSVRDAMKKDPAGTLKKIAALGYTHVEYAGYENGKFYGYSPNEFKSLLSDLGLKMLSGHNGLDATKWDKSQNEFTEEWVQTIQDAAAVGLQYMISPGVDESLCKNESDFKWYMELHNKTGELCQKAGIKFAFHNESYEFDHYLNNVRLYDILLDTTDKSLVAQQIDIGNMYAPGGRAMDYLKRYPGRFFSMHVKDVVKTNKQDNTYENTILGKGVVGVKEILEYARKTGTKHFIIEQEDYQDKTPLECAKEDLAAMKNWGF